MVLEGSVFIDMWNKVIGKYSFNINKGLLKYMYVYGSGVILEFLYDFGIEVWYFVVFKKVGLYDYVCFCFDV